MQAQQALRMPLLERPSLAPLRMSFLTLVKFHLADWLAAAALGGIFYGLHVLHPFQRFVGRGMMDDLRYPSTPETVPFVVVPAISAGVPAAVILGFYLLRRDIRDLHHSLLGLTFAICLSGVVTDGLKDAVGRPRPDFFWRCFPDGKDKYSAIGEALCTGDESVIREGHKSFPSGHASWCFSGLGYLSLYLAGKLQVFDRQGHTAKLVVPVVPLLVSIYISITRVNNYRHHWQDVSAAALIGLTVAVLTYRQHFPSLEDINCRETYTQMTLATKAPDPEEALS